MRKTFKRRFIESADAILDRYLPTSGEGENMAEQAVTATNKIEFGWYNDGDVFDNTYQLEGWANDLSCYANWLHHYVPGAAEVLAGIKNISSDAEYAALVQELKNVVYNEGLLRQLEAEAALDSIYECDGPYKFEDCTCPECGISCSQAELDEYGSCYDCYERSEDSYDDGYDFEESYSRKAQLRRRVKESSARRQPKARRLRESEEVSAVDAVRLAFPKLSEVNQDLIMDWYFEEGAAEDFDSNEDFADHISVDIGAMIDASDYNSDEVQSLINELVDLGYLDENLWEPEDDLDESYSRRRPRPNYKNARMR